MCRFAMLGLLANWDIPGIPGRDIEEERRGMAGLGLGGYDGFTSSGVLEAASCERKSKSWLTSLLAKSVWPKSGSRLDKSSSGVMGMSESCTSAPNSVAGPCMLVKSSGSNPSSPRSDVA